MTQTHYTIGVGTGERFDVFVWNTPEGARQGYYETDVSYQRLKHVGL